MTKRQVSPTAVFAVSLITLMSITSHAMTREEYERSIEEMPVPTTQAEHERACRDLRVEAARQRSFAEGASRVASGAKLAEFEMIGRRNEALLNAKAEQFRCSEPFQSSLGNKGTVMPSAIEQCIAACKENTSRTGEQCFDSCNK